jgi:hypothetical protein
MSEYAKDVWDNWRLLSIPLGDPELIEKVLAWVHNAISAWGEERRKYHVSRLNAIKAALKEIK